MPRSTDLGPQSHRVTSVASRGSLLTRNTSLAENQAWWGCEERIQEVCILIDTPGGSEAGGLWTTLGETLKSMTPGFFSCE